MESGKLKSFKDFVGTNTRQNIVELIRKVSKEYYAKKELGDPLQLRSHLSRVRGGAYYLAMQTNPWISNDTIRIYNIPHFLSNSLVYRFIEHLLNALKSEGYKISKWSYDYNKNTSMAKADLEAGYVDITFKNLQPIERFNENKLEGFKDFKFRYEIEEIIHLYDTFCTITWVSPKEIIVQELPPPLKMPNGDLMNPVVRSIMYHLKTIKKFDIKHWEYDYNKGFDSLNIIFK